MGVANCFVNALSESLFAEKANLHNKKKGNKVSKQPNTKRKYLKTAYLIDKLYSKYITNTYNYWKVENNNLCNGCIGYDFLLFLLFCETGFLCVTALAVQELAIVDQTGLELTETHLPLPPKCWD